MFGSTGVIAESVVHETRETTKYNHLVANTAILNYMQRMSCKLTALLQKGAPGRRSCSAAVPARRKSARFPTSRGITHPDHGFFVKADSTGRRNTAFLNRFQVLVQSFSRRLPAKRFPGPGVQRISNGLNLSSAPPGQIRALWEVLPSRYYLLCHAFLHTVKKSSNFLLYVESSAGLKSTAVT